MGLQLPSSLSLLSSQNYLHVRVVFLPRSLPAESEAECPVPVEITSEERRGETLKVSQNPTKLLWCVASQTYLLFYDMINLTAYTGLILPALGLPHLGRRCPSPQLHQQLCRSQSPGVIRAILPIYSWIAEPLAVGAC